MSTPSTEILHDSSIASIDILRLSDPLYFVKASPSPSFEDSFSPEHTSPAAFYADSFDDFEDNAAETMNVNQLSTYNYSRSHSRHASAPVEHAYMPEQSMISSQSHYSPFSPASTYVSTHRGSVDSTYQASESDYSELSSLTCTPSISADWYNLAHNQNSGFYSGKTMNLIKPTDLTPTQDHYSSVSRSSPPPVFKVEDRSWDQFTFACPAPAPLPVTFQYSLPSMATPLIKEDELDFEEDGSLIYLEEDNRSKRRKTTAADATHSCKLCGKLFRRLYNCRIHMELHNPNRQRPHVCNAEINGRACGREFHRLTDLQRHDDSVHKKIKAYACKFCPSRFARKDTLRRHQEDGCENRPHKPLSPRKPRHKTVKATKHDDDEDESDAEA